MKKTEPNGGSLNVEHIDTVYSGTSDDTALLYDHHDPTLWPRLSRPRFRGNRSYVHCTDTVVYRKISGPGRYIFSLCVYFTVYDVM